jgi:hypothetical protein
MARPWAAVKRASPVCRRWQLRAQRTAVKRGKAEPGGVITACLAGTAGRNVSREPLNVNAAVVELREIANGRGDLQAEQGDQ